MKRKITQDDLDMNPHLVSQGLKVGDEIEFEQTQSSIPTEEDGLPHPPTVPIKPKKD